MMEYGVIPCAVSCFSLDLKPVEARVRGFGVRRVLPFGKKCSVIGSKFDMLV